MIEHMNDDHADACLLYAQHLGNHADATAARLTDIDRRSMTLLVSLEDGTEKEMQHQFREKLLSTEHAAKVLAGLAKDARGG